MYRTTTPTLRYNFSGAAPDDFAVIVITISQYGKTVIQKQKEDCMIDENVVTVDLSQEETKRLKEGRASTQVKAVTSGGKAFVSKIIVFTVEGVLDDNIVEVSDE